MVMKKMRYALLAGFIFGLIYLAGLPLFVGYGGGLGFRATLSVLITLGIQFIEEKIRLT